MNKLDLFFISFLFFILLPYFCKYFFSIFLLNIIFFFVFSPLLSLEVFLLFTLFLQFPLKYNCTYKKLISPPSLLTTEAIYHILFVCCFRISLSHLNIQNQSLFLFLLFSRSLVFHLCLFISFCSQMHLILPSPFSIFFFPSLNFLPIGYVNCKLLLTENTLSLSFLTTDRCVENSRLTVVFYQHCENSIVPHSLFSFSFLNSYFQPLEFCYFTKNF